MHLEFEDPPDQLLTYRLCRGRKPSWIDFAARRRCGPAVRSSPVSSIRHVGLRSDGVARPSMPPGTSNGDPTPALLNAAIGDIDPSGAWWARVRARFGGGSRRRVWNLRVAANRRGSTRQNTREETRFGSDRRLLQVADAANEPRHGEPEQASRTFHGLGLSSS